MVTVEIQVKIDFQPKAIANRLFQQLKSNSTKPVRTVCQAATTAAHPVHRTTAKAIRNSRQTVTKATTTLLKTAVDGYDTGFDAIFGSPDWIRKHPNAFTFRFVAAFTLLPIPVFVLAHLLKKA